MKIEQCMDDVPMNNGNVHSNVRFTGRYVKPANQKAGFRRDIGIQWITDIYISIRLCI